MTAIERLPNPIPKMKVLSLLACSAVIACNSLCAAPLIVSDILETPLKSALPGTLECRYAGSIVALEELRSGRADIVVAAIADGNPLPEGMLCIPLAFECAVVVVNNSNPLDKIGLDELGKIFAGGEAMEKWGALGLSDAWRERSISVFIPAPGEGITLPLLRSVAMQGKPVREGAGIITSASQLETVVREQSQSITLLRGLAVPSGGRALSITSSEGLAYPPSVSSVFYGDYPLRLPFYVVLRPDAPAPVQDTLAQLLDNKVAAALAAYGYVPAPESERDLEVYFPEAVQR